MQPPDTLSAQLFPFVNLCLAAVEDAIKAGGDKHTALRFLKKLKNLRVIALQDAAVLMSLGRKHRVFDLPVFQSDEFKEFQRLVLEEISTCEQARTQDKISDIAPELAQRLDLVQETSALCCRRMEESNRVVSEMKKELGRLTLNLDQRFGNLQNDHHRRDEVIANQFRATADLLSPLRHSQQTEGSIAGTPMGATTNQSTTASRPVERTQRQSIAPGVAAVRLNFTSAAEIYDQYHGLGLVNGGSMASAEAQHGKEWRRHWDQGQEQRYGRVKRAAEAMKIALAATFGGDRAAMLVEFDRIFREAPKANNLAGFIDKLQQRNYIPKKTRQSRKARNTAVVNNTTATVANNTATVMVQAVANTATVDAATIVNNITTVNTAEV